MYARKLSDQQSAGAQRKRVRAHPDFGDYAERLPLLEALIVMLPVLAFMLGPVTAGAT